MTTKRYCLALDLKDDPALIQKYTKHHAPGKVWPEITGSIKQAGIVEMEIYLTGNRLFMIIEVDESFDFHKKAQDDKNNPKVQQWENLMSKYQQQLPWASAVEKWVKMDKIFELQ